LDTRIEPIKHRSATTQRHLLLEDDVNKGRKAGRAAPHRRFAMREEYLSEFGIACGQVASGRRESLCSEYFRPVVLQSTDSERQEVFE